MSDRAINRNVEIKAKVADLGAIECRARALADTGPVALEQEDTFFGCGRGRLKLRQFGGTEEAELIYYERPASTGPKESKYLIHRTAKPAQLSAVLAASLGIRGVVRKRRTLYLIGPTRVHLDRVEGLGDYVELEVVRQPGETTSRGVAIANDLMDELGIPRDALIEKAYIDLLE
jgi:predicted adenylyl cyclase CyaB